MAISVIWPITLPVVLAILFRQPRPASRGFEVVSEPRPPAGTPGP
jgi:hypothetical protein